MAKDKVRVCMMCCHFHLEAGGQGYSDMTPGWDFDMGCRKNVWEWKPCDTSEGQYREMMLKAERCKYYLYYKHVQVAEELHGDALR